MAAPAPFVLTCTGPECTGKSTLALALARSYGAELSAEAARLYADARRAASRVGTPAAELLGPGDVEPIARAQLALESEAAERAAQRDARVLVRDTDLVSTVVYARHYYGACPTWIVDTAVARRADLYLLGDIDLPWRDDGVRDADAPRDVIRTLFARTLDALGCRWTLVNGTGPARERRARELVDAVLDGQAFGIA